jgi:hypothetical protein
MNQQVQKAATCVINKGRKLKKMKRKPMGEGSWPLLTHLIKISKYNFQ